MPTLVTIKNVLAGAPWSNDHGTFHPFALTVDETNQPIEVNRKPDSPALQVGQQVWVETKPGRNGALKGKIVPPPDQQQSFAPRPTQTASGSRPPSVTHDDPTRRSIERQTCMRAAGDLYHGTSTAPLEVVKAADIFFGWVSQS